MALIPFQSKRKFKQYFQFKKLLLVENHPRLSLYKDPDKIINTDLRYREILSYVEMPPTIKEINLQIIEQKKIQAAHKKHKEEIQSKLKSTSDKEEKSSKIRKTN